MPKGVYTIQFVNSSGAPLSSRTDAVDKATLRIGQKNPDNDMLLSHSGQLQLLTRHYKGLTDRMMTLLGKVHRQIRGETVVGQEALADQVLASITDKVRTEMRQDAALRDWLGRNEILPAHLASLIGRVNRQLPLRDADFFEDASELVAANVAHRNGGIGTLEIKVFPKGRFKVIRVTPPKRDLI